MDEHTKVRVEIDQWGTLVAVFDKGRGTVRLVAGHYEITFKAGPTGYMDINLLRCPEQPLINYIRIFNHDGSVLVG